MRLDGFGFFVDDMAKMLRLEIGSWNKPYEEKDLEAQGS